VSETGAWERGERARRNDYPAKVRLEIGDLVAYPPHGVGRITARRKTVVHDVEQEVVVIELQNTLSVTLPLPRALELLRPPVSKSDLQHIKETLRDAGAPDDEVWSKRIGHLQEKLRNGDPLELAEIVRDGVRRQERLTESGTRFKLSTSERTLLLRAWEYLSSEIAIVLDVGPGEADAWIDEQLAGVSR
jgi:CarD family transcriptional regulator